MSNKYLLHKYLYEPRGRLHSEAFIINLSFSTNGMSATIIGDVQLAVLTVPTKEWTRVCVCVKGTAIGRKEDLEPEAKMTKRIIKTRKY